MKKQFAIKAVQATKNNVLSVAKRESESILRLAAGDIPCCYVMAFQGVSSKLTFSL
ncbi:MULTISPECIES: hypothetical protein [Spirosoma]|uniref:Uncharacterized protein n=1 Tax=Spirosoma liriopis TaxID=2937440 RepID=A0ABT0HJW9_9BACT|nr:MULTISPECIES: hypothetical protein [Spirosoma]MCK8492466.1 hypothetical protein [Spirosoma liriopis]UHG91937.1 hypothetical protein LQ777_03310 [Spirosoma oryzicola]